MGNRVRLHRLTIGGLAAVASLPLFIARAMAAPPTALENNTAALLIAVAVLLGLLLGGGLVAYSVRYRGNGFATTGEQPGISQRGTAFAITAAGFILVLLGLAAILVGASDPHGKGAGLSMRFSSAFPDPWAPAATRAEAYVDAPTIPAVETGRLTSGGEPVAGATLELEESGYDAGVARVETGTDGTFAIPFGGGSNDLRVIRVVALPDQYEAQDSVLVSQRMMDATQFHPRFVAADAIKPLGIQTPAQGGSTGKPDRGDHLHLAIVPRLELGWPPPDQRPVGALADPKASRIRWDPHPKAALYVVHLDERPHTERGLSSDRIAYVVEEGASLPLAGLSGRIAVAGRHNRVPEAAQHHSLYGVRVVAFDARGRVVARTASVREGHARFRLPGLELRTTHTDDDSKRDPERQRIGDGMRAMEQRADYDVARYLAELGRSGDTRYFIERMEQRRRGSDLYKGRPSVGFVGEEEVDRLKQRVCCGNNAQSE